MTIRTSPTTAPQCRGVFDADPQNPPVAPPDAVGVFIRNSAGVIIAYTWVIPDMADDTFYTKTWACLDSRDPVTPASSARLRLVP